MNPDKREKELNGRIYSILMPAPSQGMPLCTETAVTIGPLLGGIDLAQRDGGNILSLLLRGIDPTALDRLFMRAVEVCKLTVDGTPICTQVTFDKHFSQCRGDMFPVCIWALTEAVKDFFPVLAAFTQGASQMLQTG